MGRYLLGEFEHLVLLTVLRLKDDAYGVSVTRELEAHTGKSVSQAATYLTLRRLEEKGWIVGRSVPGTARRGDRRKKCYRLTDEGLAMVRTSRETLLSLWSSLDEQLS